MINNCQFKKNGKGYQLKSFEIERVSVIRVVFHETLHCSASRQIFICIESKLSHKKEWYMMGDENKVLSDE